MIAATLLFMAIRFTPFVVKIGACTMSLCLKATLLLSLLLVLLEVAICAFPTVLLPLVLIILPLVRLIVVRLVFAACFVAMASVIILEAELVPMREAAVNSKDPFDHANTSLSSEHAPVDVMDLPFFHFSRRKYAVLEQ